MIESPCIQICVVNPDTNLCEGCHRNMDEIARWESMSDQDRRRIMGDLPRRKTPNKLG